MPGGIVTTAGGGAAGGGGVPGAGCTAVRPGTGELPGGICSVTPGVGGGGAPITTEPTGSAGTLISGGGPLPSEKLLCGPM